MATRYWVGGTGTWDAVDTTHWSASSGGAGGASVPGSGDYVIINASSGGGLITIDSDKTIQGFDIRQFTGTFDFSTFILNLTANASTTVRQDSTATISGTKIVNLTYAGSTGTRTIGLTGVTESNALTVNVTAGTDTVTTTAASIFKSLNFTGFSGTLSNTTKTIYSNLIVSSGMTLTAGTGATTFAATSGTQQITTNGKTLDFPLMFNGIGGTFAFQDALTQGSTRAFTITNGTVQLKNGVTSTVGAFATSGTNQKFLESTLAGSQATLSQASGTVSASYLTIKDINATGGATWNAFTTNNNVDAGNNLGWDFSFQTGKYIYTVRKNKRILP